MNESINGFNFTVRNSFTKVKKLAVDLELVKNFNNAGKLFLSHGFLLLQLIMCVFYFHYGATLEAIAFFGTVFILALFVSNDLQSCTAPMFFASMAVLKSYGITFDAFAGYVALVVILFIAAIFHLIVYRPKKFRFGRQGFAILFVAFAILMGGAGLSKGPDYYGGSIMYYIIGLSVGASLTYFILRNYIKTDFTVNFEKKPRTEGAIYLFARIMCYAVAAGALMLVFEAIIPAVEKYGGEKLWVIQWSNNLSTFMLIAMPFPFMLAAKSKMGVHYFVLGLICASTCILTLSRGGMLFGFIMLMICMAATLIMSKGKNRIYLLGATVVAIVVAVLLFVLAADFIEKLLANMSINAGESRVNLYRLAVENFFKHPFFGTGLGYQGEFYNPQEIAMYWYHSTPYQVIASLGLLGVAAYGYQFYNRLDVIFEKFNVLNLFVFLSFLGFELMALVNPGDFCPVPYVFVIIQITLLSELYNTKNYDYDKKEFLHAGKRIFYANQTLYGGKKPNLFFDFFA